jgi:hypothetical protein
MIEPPPRSLQAGRRRPVAACWGADSYQQAARAAPDCRGAVERPCATRPRHTVAGMSAASCTSLQALEARLQQHAVAASLSEQRAPAAAADDDDDLAGQYLQLPKGTETHREKQCAFCKVRGDGGHRGRNTRFHRCRRTQPTPPGHAGRKSDGLASRHFADGTLLQPRANCRTPWWACQACADKNLRQVNARSQAGARGASLARKALRRRVTPLGDDEGQEQLAGDQQQEEAEGMAGVTTNSDDVIYTCTLITQLAAPLTKGWAEDGGGTFRTDAPLTSYTKKTTVLTVSNCRTTRFCHARNIPTVQHCSRDFTPR